MTRGADAVTAALADAGIRLALAFPGTSELALCESVSASSRLRLINARGDREAVFIAAGANAFADQRAAAVLHGARGLTNALGAVADVRRNEIALVALVGLAATTYAHQQPPHEEPELVERAAGFAKAAWRAGPDDDPGMLGELVQRAATFAARHPRGPVLIGLPQDVAERRWPAVASWAATVIEPPPAAAPDDVRRASALIKAASRPLIVVDDYFGRLPGAREALHALVRCTGAEVRQIRYRRGAMLFERVRDIEDGRYVQWLDPHRPGRHEDPFADCDLLLTLEDRNLYPRVSGPLPDVRKVALTSSSEKTRKNAYLGDMDILLAGDVVALTRELINAMPPGGAEANPAANAPRPTPDNAMPNTIQRRLVRALLEGLGDCSRLLIVDDSQTFGGLVADHSDLIPGSARVLGDHGGFVGGGIAYATGVALGDRDAHVLCLLGDSGFGNGCQALIAAAELSGRLLCIVANNGGSVSLQIERSSRGARAPVRQVLSNPPALSYTRLAQGCGISAQRIDLRDAHDETAVLRELSASLAGWARDAAAPRLIELLLPDDPGWWQAFWATP